MNALAAIGLGMLLVICALACVWILALVLMEDDRG